MVACGENLELLDHMKMDLFMASCRKPRIGRTFQLNNLKFQCKNYSVTA